MADAEQPTAEQGPSAEDTPSSPIEWLKKKLGMTGGGSPTGNKSEDAQLAEEDGTGKKANQSTDSSNGY
jgi:hypothetical protein